MRRSLSFAVVVLVALPVACADASGPVTSTPKATYTGFVQHDKKPASPGPSFHGVYGVSRRSSTA